MKEIDMSNAGHSFMVSRLLIFAREISPVGSYKAIESLNNSSMMGEEGSIYLSVIPLFKVCPKVINTYGLHLQLAPNGCPGILLLGNRKPQGRSKRCSLRRGRLML